MGESEADGQQPVPGFFCAGCAGERGALVVRSAVIRKIDLPDRITIDKKSSALFQGCSDPRESQFASFRMPAIQRANSDRKSEIELFLAFLENEIFDRHSPEFQTARSDLFGRTFDRL